MELTEKSVKRYMQCMFDISLLVEVVMYRRKVVILCVSKDASSLLAGRCTAYMVDAARHDTLPQDKGHENQGFQLRRHEISIGHFINHLDQSG